MDKESDVIKLQMEHTRAALTDKLEMLEHQVADTVTGAAETVEKVRQTVQETVSGAVDTVTNMQHCIQDTVASVRESVRETAETVSESLDLRKQVDKHPWAMMAGATAVGFGVGILVTQTELASSRTFRHKAEGNNHRSDANNFDSAGSSFTHPQDQNRSQNGRHRKRVESLEESPWAPAVNKLKGLAIGAMFGVLRDVLSNSMPNAISGQVSEVIDNFTTSLGGQPLSGRILPEDYQGWPSKEKERRDKFSPPRQTAMADIEE